MIDLPQAFLNRMKNALGESYFDFLSCYNRSAHRAIRVNTLKISVDGFKKISPFDNLRQVEWEPNGFYVQSEKTGKNLLHAAGLYYAQEPSAMSAVPLLNVQKGEKVLDMCSAPGGKGTQIAQALSGSGILVLNEVNFSRAKILSQNVERLGITNAALISESPARVGEYFSGYFDKVLVDAPCSGEGMFLKEENAVTEWSEENVLACAKRQQAILDSAQQALKTGGLLVYSTCTFAPEEDEGQIDSFLKRYKNFKLLHMKKLLPHECEGEGHFVALLQKTDGEECDPPLFKLCADKSVKSDYAKLLALSGVVPNDDGNLHRAGEFLYRIMPNCPALPFKTLRCGLRVGEYKKDRIEPCHALAMSSSDRFLYTVDLDEQCALSYLRGNEINCGDNYKNGWAVITYKGFALGWCKISGGTAKNHLPKALRI